MTFAAGATAAYTMPMLEEAAKTAQSVAPIALAFVSFALAVFGPILAKKGVDLLSEKLSRSQEVALLDVLHYAYQTTEKLAKLTPGDIDDKLAHSLRLAEEHLGRKLSASEKKAASNFFSARAAAGKLEGA